MPRSDETTTGEVDSLLGRCWAFSERRPAELAHVVERIWHFAGRVDLRRERTFPDGYLELILHLGERYREVGQHGAPGAFYPVACVSALQTGPLVVEAPAGPSWVMGIRLRPAWAQLVLGCPVRALSQCSVDLVDVVGSEATELVERCHEAPGIGQRFDLIQRWITHRLLVAGPRWRTSEEAVMRATAHLERNDGLVTVSELRQRAGLGQTRFVQAFRERVGLTPKRYARVLRFRHALSLLQGGRRLSDLALEAGFYDQAHLNADFREFARMTPTEYEQGLHYSNSLSLAEEG